MDSDVSWMPQWETALDRVFGGSGMIDTWHLPVTTLVILQSTLFLSPAGD